jgi:hypothetical protein
VVYLLDADHIDGAAGALSAADLTLAQLYVPALVTAHFLTRFNLAAVVALILLPAATVRQRQLGNGSTFGREERSCSCFAG